MSTKRQNTTAQHLAHYLERVLEDRVASAQASGAELAAAPVPGQLLPAFWADAPWRMEPGQSEIPFTFLVRDGQSENRQLRLKEIAVYEAPDDNLPWADKAWRLWRPFLW